MNVVLTFEPVDEIIRDTGIQIKDTGRYSVVVLFITAYRVVLIFESVDEILII